MRQVWLGKAGCDDAWYDMTWQAWCDQSVQVKERHGLAGLEVVVRQGLVTPAWQARREMLWHAKDRYVLAWQAQLGSGLMVQHGKSWLGRLRRVW